MVFEKDTEIVKYKKICKKWKTKYQNLQLSSNYKGLENTPNPSNSYMSNSSVSVFNNSSTKKNLDMKENVNSSSKEYATNANLTSSAKKSFFDKLFN